MIIVKKKHLIRLALICVFIFSVYLPVLLNIVHLSRVKNDEDQYTIKQAIIIKMHYKARDVYRSTLSFEDGEQKIEKDFPHNLFDYVGKEVLVVINKDTMEISRMQISISYIHLMCLAGGIALLLIEHIRYQEDKRKYMKRKIKEMNINS